MVNEVVATGSNLRKASGENLDIRDRVLIGLAIKAYNSFECLTQDASNWRSEAFHHLKTLAETHIYFQWVGIRTDHSRAKLLLGKATKEKINFLEANSQLLDSDCSGRKPLELTLTALAAGNEQEWKRFQQKGLRKIAMETNSDMVGWYDRVFRPACEPAHISDLVEYMPRADEKEIRLMPVAAFSASKMRAMIAIDYGLQIMCDFMRNMSDVFSLGLAEPIKELKLALDNSRNRRSATTAGGM